jgi:valyl-tRNA synthetase
MSNDYKNIGFIVAENAEAAQKLALEKFPQLKDGNYKLVQDEDSLDTWFSSWLWPVSVFDGINNPDNEEIKYYYPTSDLVTAPDIIFFWVARMIMAGEEYRGEEPFRNVYFTGIVRDKLGRKMSKQLGNSPDPIELMNKYGADGVRMGMLLSAPAGNDIHFDEALCEQGRNFCNKIWNAFRLVKGWEIDYLDNEMPQKNVVATYWFHNVLIQAKKEVDDLFSKYRLSEALTLIYKLFWDDFCAWYLEIVKPEFGKPVDKGTYNFTENFFEHLVKLLHPFMPFITEEIYQQIKAYLNESKSIMIDNDEDYFYHSENPNEVIIENIISNFEKVKEVITNIRNIRASKNISPKEKLTLQVNNEHNADYNEVIKKLANVEIEDVGEKSAGAVSFMVGTCEYAVPVGNLINADEEIKKMQAEIAYLEGFLKSVNAKLSNEKFVANAKPEIVENERKKKNDAEQKLASLNENIENFKR